MQFHVVAVRDLVCCLGLAAIECEGEPTVEPYVCVEKHNKIQYVLYVLYVVAYIHSSHLLDKCTTVDRLGWQISYVLYRTVFERMTITFVDD